MNLNMVGYILLIAVVSYCCGSFNGAILVSHFHYKSDIREQGSGNAGLSNFYRTYGTTALCWVVLIDLGKAFVAAFTGGILMNVFGMQKEGQAIALLFVIVGHMFPATYDFRGGKGVLSAFGALIVIDWRLALALLGVFAVIVAIWRYSSLGSIIGTLLLPLGIWLLGYGTVTTVLTMLSALLVVYMHRANIDRLLHGKENKLSF